MGTRVGGGAGGVVVRQEHIHNHQQGDVVSTKPVGGMQGGAGGGGLRTKERGWKGRTASSLKPKVCTTRLETCGVTA